MNGQIIIFWIFAVISVVTALMVVLHRDPVRAALALVLNFTCLALFYFLLNAQVLAVLQIVVYAGAIMVLFMFVIMLLNLGGERAQTDPLVGQRPTAALLGVLLLVGLSYATFYSKQHAPPVSADMVRIQQAEEQGLSQIQIIGWDLFTKYVYPFELTSILLLVGVIGVVLLTKRRAATVTGDGNS